MQDPIRYTPDLEDISDDERQTIDEMNETFDDILKTVEKDEGHAYRSVHAKSHGLVEATVTIPEGLDPQLAQGIFARPGTHEAIMRISTNPGDILDDSVSVPRGMALKVLNVEGKRLRGSEDATCQDFVMANGPVFSAATAADFLGSLKILAKTTDRAEWAKKAVSKVLRGVNAVMEKTTGPSATIQTMGGAPNTHPLGQRYWSQTPFRFGDYVAKFSLVPVSDNLTALSDTTVDASGRPDALREEVDDTLRNLDAPARWELKVQLLRDRDAQPIEDATVEWDEETSPFETVATVEAKAQPGWTETRAAHVDDGMVFAPWNGIAAHEPLGSINRARLRTYDNSARFRERVNGCPVRHPTSADLPA